MKLTLENDQATIFNKIPIIARRMGSWTLGLFERLAGWLAAKSRAERIVLLALAAGLPILVFYNLELNPRSWVDEGAALHLARTLAEDGVYAMRNSDGYQTFGPVQSVGPTLIVPVALVYRLLGAGLLQGRYVAAVYTLVALLLFILDGQKLFDRWSAILGLVFLLAAPGVRILGYGRMALGEVPALAFFLAGWLALSRALQSRRLGWTVLAGLLFGAAILTKSQYLIMIPASLCVLAILDLVYYRQQAWKILGLVTVLALCCVFAWQAWQASYFGLETYQANLATLRQLASVTAGFRLSTVINALRLIMGNEGGNFYLFWGFPALGYMFVLAARRNLKGLLLALLAIFTSFWLVYFTFCIVPTPVYSLPAMSLLALFVAKLYADLLRAAWPILREYLRNLPPAGSTPVTTVLAMGTLVGLLSYGLWIGYSLEKYVRSDVLDRIGDDPASIFSLPHLQYPRLAAEYIEKNIPTGAVIETWERELSILTDLTYHSPDQSMLVYTHPLLYGGSQSDYLLGEDYFKKAKVNYVILGWFTRLFPVYDLDYLEQNSELVITIGEGNYNYEIYRLIH